jgi:hypothetical protein
VRISLLTAFTLNRRMNSGAKVCSSRTELRAFVKDYIFFFVRLLTHPVNSFFCRLFTNLISYLFLIITTTSQGLHSLSTPTALNSHSSQLPQLSASMECFSVMNILAHTTSRSSAIAAQTIQRAWKTSPAYTTQLRANAQSNASQLGSQPFGHVSLTGDTDFLNLNHSFWRWSGMEPHGPVEVKQKISFSDECLVRAAEDGVATTDFHDTPDKSSRLFANTIVSLFEGKKPLYKLFSHPNALAMEPHFKDAIAKLESGQRVSIWDGNSTKLQATDRTLVAVKECFVKYNYFMKSFGQSVQKVTIPSCGPTPASKPEKPLTCTMKPLKTTGPTGPMGLVRLAPRKVAGVVDQRPRADQVSSVDDGFSVADLEARLHKMMNLPYAQ